MVRLKRSDPPPVGRRPKRMNSCDLTLNFSIYFFEYFSISRSEKASFPAGTGVWVVKIVLLFTASNASAYVSPSSRVNLSTPSRTRKTRLSLIHMPHIRPKANCFKRLYTTYAEQYFLRYPYLMVASIQVGG